ncbi:hypothetical protein BDV19DRAFT_11631 [Aspergillus venezuelensis]
MAIALGQATGIARLAIETLTSSAGFEDISFAITVQMATIHHIKTLELIQEIPHHGLKRIRATSSCRPGLYFLRFAGGRSLHYALCTFVALRRLTGTPIKFVEAGFDGHVVATASDLGLYNGVPFLSPAHCLAEIVLQCSALTSSRAQLLSHVARRYQGLTDSNSALRLTSFQWDAILSELPRFV